MKRLVFSLLLLLCGGMAASAQSMVKYGTLSYNELLKAMPEYAEAKTQVANLRLKYEAEATYNEQSFKRQFAEFLQGQKDFPQNILLKRQRDLQDAMEKGLAFRHEADSLLREAEVKLMEPVKQHLNTLIKAVGMEHGYEYILNTDNNAYPFLHPSVVEDAGVYVREKIQGL